MRLIPVTKHTLSYMHALYKEAFPKKERKPFSLLLKKQKQGIADLFLIEEENNSPLGLLITMQDPSSDIVLLDYLAITPNGRGKGTGSQALSLFRLKYEGKRLLLEIEKPDPSAANSKERLRRKNFYLRNHFTKTGICVQVYGVEMELLTNGCPLTFEDYVLLYKNAMGKLHTAFLRIKKIS